jgi:hypothetical protein
MVLAHRRSLCPTQKDSTRTIRNYSSRDYYQWIEHVRKYPETTFEVLNSLTGLLKIENWKNGSYIWDYGKIGIQMTVVLVSKIYWKKSQDFKTFQISVSNVVQHKW